MTRTSIILLLLLNFLTGTVAQDFPEARISNGIITVHLYLPDQQTGYYRATRFDWSGIIPRLEYNGHTYFGQWFDKYSPTINDAIMGPVEEFGPVGYDDVKPGGNFIRIGVGALEKPEEPAFGQFKLYNIANPGTWKIDMRKDQLKFTHELKEPEYAYEYCKTIRTVKGKPQMVIFHSLKNTGKKTIETLVYDHNFMIIDGEVTGPNYVIHFPVDVTGEGQGIGTYARFEGKNMVFTGTPARSIFVNPVKGFGNDRKDYNFTIENMKTGAGVKITGDQPINKLVFWASPRTVCPEPFIRVKVEPGKTFKWEISYDFFTTDTVKKN